MQMPDVLIRLRRSAPFLGRMQHVQVFLQRGGHIRREYLQVVNMRLRQVISSS